MINSQSLTKLLKTLKTNTSNAMSTRDRIAYFVGMLMAEDEKLADTVREVFLTDLKR